MNNLYVGIPTRNLTTLAPSLIKVMFAAIGMEHFPSITVSDASTVCMARSAIITDVKRIAQSRQEISYGSFERKVNPYIRMLWLDSDIFIDNEANDLITIIKDADANNKNIVGFYNLTDKRGSMTGLDGVNIDYDKFKQIEQYAPLQFAGLGFYYGYTPLDYSFHEQFNAGEDFNFFRDNKIDLCVDKRIILHHNKQVFI